MIRRNLSNLGVESVETEEGIQLSFIASTGTPDRYGDIVDPRGWNLENYEKNPIVLLNHNPNNLPIGRGNVRFSDDKLWKDRKLLIDVDFDMNDPESARIAQKAKNGFLNSVSVGFNPKNSVKRSDLEEKHWAYSAKGGMFFESAELLEVSVVTIPANPEAVILQNYTVRELTDLVKKMIHDDVMAQADPFAEVRGKVKSIEEIGEFLTIKLDNTEESKKAISKAFPEIEIKKQILGFNHYLISALTE